MKLPGSNFVSRVGIGVLLLLILVTAYLGYGLLEAFLAVIALLCLCAYLWARFSLRRVSVKMDVSECSAFPGQLLEADACLKNEKFLPLLWLDLRFPTEGKSCVAPASAEEPEAGGEEDRERDICESFSWIMPHQSLRWRQTALAVHRGVCRVDSVELSSGDGFGLTVQSRRAELPGGFRFLVYPRIVPVDVSAVLRNMSELEPAKSGFYTDRTLLAGTRDYREGDSFRDINWRLLARSDSLQVNVHETLAMRRVCFVPDLQSFRYQAEVEVDREKKWMTLVREEELEQMFSLLASLILRLHEREMLCTLVIPAVGEAPARILVPETRDTQVMEHLAALAEVEYAGEDARLPLDEMEDQRHRLGQVYILSHHLEEDASGPEELGAFRIVQELPEEESFDRHILKETDFLMG